MNAVGTIKGQPIDGFYLVEASGQVALGPAHGRVDVNGLNCEQAEGKIKEHLKKVLMNPEVQVTPARRRTVARSRAAEAALHDRRL